MAGKQTAVLGAGALGLTLAYRLAQLGDAVTVFEREDAPGGLTSGFKVASRADGSSVYLEKFYHHLFRADHAVIALIEEIGLGSKLVWPKPTSAILRDGGIYRLDGAIALLKLKPLPLADRVRMGAVIAYLKMEKGYQRLEGQTAKQWLTKWLGPNGYEVFAEPLLRQKFGDYSDKIAMPWFWSRVHLRSTSLGYLLGGFQQLYDVLAERIQHLGGTIRLGSPVTSISPMAKGGLKVSAKGGGETFDRVVSTLPARLTIGLTKGMPEDFKTRYGSGDAYGAHCLVLELDRQVTDQYWIAVNDPGYPFLAVVEHTNYIPPAEYEGKHLMYVGNYLPMHHPLYERPAEDILAGFMPYLRKINPEMRESWVTGLHSFSAPYAQPLVTTDFKAAMAPHVTPVPNLYMANMFQIYPQDRGQNYSVTMAERMVRLLNRPDVSA